MNHEQRRSRIVQLLDQGVDHSEIYTTIAEEFGCTRDAAGAATRRVLANGYSKVENDGEEQDFARMDFETREYIFSFFKRGELINTFAIPFDQIQEYVEAYVYQGRGMTRKQVANLAWVNHDRKLTHDYVRRIFRCVDIMKASPPVAPHRYEEELVSEIADSWHARDEAMVEARYRAKEHRKLRNTLRAKTEQLLNMQDFIVAAIEGAEIVSTDVPDWTPIPFEGKDRPIDAFMMLSDWHIGLEVDQWYNQFNPDSAQNRIDDLLDQLNAYAKLHKGSIASYTNAWLGDMLDSVHANMHSEQHLEQSTHGVDQVLLAAKMMAYFNRSVAKIFGPDVRNVATPGNHDRSTQSRGGDVQRLPGLLAYYLAQEMFRTDHPWQIDANRTLSEVPMGQYLVIVGHGDRTPRKIAQMARPRIHKGQHVVVLSGHLHSLHMDGLYDSQFTHLRNGSLCGSTGYSFDQLGLHQCPAQAMCELTKDGVRMVPFFLKDGFEPGEP